MRRILDGLLKSVAGVVGGYFNIAEHNANNNPIGMGAYFRFIFNVSRIFCKRDSFEKMHLKPIRESHKVSPSVFVEKQP